MSCFRDFDHKRIYPSAKLVENNLHTIRFVRLIVRLVYPNQIFRIKADYWPSFMAQNNKMLEGIQ